MKFAPLQGELLWPQRSSPKNPMHKRCSPQLPCILPPLSSTISSPSASLTSMTLPNSLYPSLVPFLPSHEHSARWCLFSGEVLALGVTIEGWGGIVGGGKGGGVGYDDGLGVGGPPGHFSGKHGGVPDKPWVVPTYPCFKMMERGWVGE
eukprot:755107-Hanusia_phi.AAC.10